MIFTKLFYEVEKGNFGLTEEAVYRSIQLGNKMIPLYGGNQQHSITERYVDEKAKTKQNIEVTVFSGEGIIISLDGSAGNMTYKKGEKFALNHHAGFIKVREESKKLVNPEFFSIFYQEQFKEASISDGSKTLTLDKLYSMDIDLPSYDDQNKLMEALRPIIKKKIAISNLINKSIILYSKPLSHQYDRYQGRDVAISEVLGYMGGNSGLTEKEIYQKILLDGEKYKVLSGSIFESSSFGYVTRFILNGGLLKVFEGKDGILVVRKGKAGHTTYLHPGKYTLTDDAYILFIRDTCSYEINIKWLQIQYGSFFYEYSSSSDNGTWNMTGFFDQLKIDVPTLKYQGEIIKKYNSLQMIKERLESIVNKINHLLTKTYATVI